ncbi:MAG: RluA family pseudouridine synthase [Clostridia bacterium]|nr:RluA family pseudouridine synthase [Clostridia bacterium]
MRADAALAGFCAEEGLSLTRSAIAKLISDGLVTKNGSPIQKNYKLSRGDVLILTVPEPEACDVAPENIPLDVVYEDGDVIVVNKPQGMVVHPAPGHATGTLVSALLYHCGDSLSGIGGVTRPGIVHRIDRDTSGLICAAKNDAAHASLALPLKDHSMARTYEAICLGRLPADEGRIEAPIGRSRTDRKKMAVVSDGRPAATNYRVLRVFENGSAMSHVELKLETGRTHQIRVHMAHVGHPLLGDSVYGGGSTVFEKHHPGVLAGQCLHAKELTFIHPSTGEKMTFSAPRPANFDRVIELLGN